MSKFFNTNRAQRIRQSFVMFTAVISVFIGLFIMTATFINTYQAWEFDKVEHTGEVNIWEYWSRVGEFLNGVVGTIFSLSGFFLLYLTFQKQKETASINNIETRLYEMLRLHKENVNEMVIVKAGDSPIAGRKVFNDILEEIKECYREIAPFFSPSETCIEDVYVENHLSNIKKLKETLPELDELQLAHLDIAYSIVFFGLQNNDLATLYRLHLKHYSEDLLKEILSFIIQKPKGNERGGLVTWKDHQRSKALSIFDGRDSKGRQQDYDHSLDNVKGVNCYYKGHQYQLGHYFRHLYQQVNYINSLTIYSYSEKYDILKTLRAQLSIPEQYVVFFNSVSFVGRSWEINPIISGRGKDQYFMSKYNIIKNIPSLSLLVGEENIRPINLRDFYPLINFDFDEEPADRRKYNKTWN